MGDLSEYVNMRKTSDKAFSKGYEDGYLSFKKGVIERMRKHLLG